MSDEPQPPAVSQAAAETPLNGSRKFMLAGFATVAAALLCYFGKLDGTQWVYAEGVILSMYGAANVLDKKFGGAG